MNLSQLFFALRKYFFLNSFALKTSARVEMIDEKKNVNCIDKNY